MAATAATQPRHLFHILLMGTFLLALATIWSALASRADAGSRTTEAASKDPGAPNCDPNWIIVTSPNIGTITNWLTAVDAVSANDVWAVGYYNASTSNKTLIERWNGTGWNVVPTPNIGLNSTFNAVTAISAIDVWAVGSYEYSTNVYRTLTMHWNGSSWAVVTSPNQGQLTSHLTAVSAISANDVWAVGDYSFATNYFRTLTLHWDGGSWQIVSSPNLSSTRTFLRGVAAISANDVWAVGDYENASGAYRTIIIHWHDDEWHTMGSPNVGVTGNTLRGVTAISTNNVWAVGSYHDDSGPDRTLILRWDGSTWNVITSPNANSSTKQLWAVEALSANDVRAVGSYQYSAGIYRTLIERWNGTQWIVVASPYIGDDSSLRGVTYVSASDVWAVGNFHDLSNYSTLVERYNPCIPSPTPTTTPTASSTPTPTSTTATPVACTIEFTDVPPGSTFYDFVRCMACRGIINGYTSGCETGNPCFRPTNNVTRGQLSKIVANAAGFNEPAGAQQFEDVLPGSTFFDFVWRLADRGHVGGYACGGPGEPCGGGNLPYFRPNGNASRGQISKIVANSAGLSDPPGSQLFEDVSASHTFYDYIQRLANLGVIGGYVCGGVGEPCGNGNLPYFRPANNATRGQTAKIVANAFFPDCSTPYRFSFTASSS